MSPSADLLSNNRLRMKSARRRRPSSVLRSMRKRPRSARLPWASLLLPRRVARARSKARTGQLALRELSLLKQRSRDGRLRRYHSLFPPFSVAQRTLELLIRRCILTGLANRRSPFQIMLDTVFTRCWLLVAFVFAAFYMLFCITCWRARLNPRSLSRTRRNRYPGRKIES